MSVRCSNAESVNIGPEMFQEIFLRAIQRQTEFLDHSVYHVDRLTICVPGASPDLFGVARLPPLRTYGGRGA